LNFPPKKEKPMQGQPVEDGEKKAETVSSDKKEE
jgi:hypothetical protein